MWGIIYILVGMFVIYQAIPSKYVGTRNDHLIFNDISYVFPINIILGPISIIFLHMDNTIGFFVAELIITVLLATTLYIMIKITRSQLNKFEATVVHSAFSFYAGWCCVATIVTAAFFLKSAGFDQNKRKDVNETNYALIMFWVAQLVFLITTYKYTNFIFGFVWLWAAFFIKKQQNDEKFNSFYKSIG